ncbi:MAG TPA: NADH-dependent flavin oxidoreductase [Sporolactobacillaceae bacterium]|nr:NADH-dependent flavin oxidoreductase [Sporolactobacillaceae bacterium]
MNPKFEPFFQPLTLPIGVQLKNRLVMAPMTNFSSHPDGTVTDEEVHYYARRSHGVGMVVTACTYVTIGGKGFHGQFGADTDDMIPSLSRVAKAIKDKGAKAIIQLYHGGRLCPPELVPDGDIVSASAVASEREGAPTPRELTEDEIHSIIKDFGKATKRAIEAGFDGVEIHGANGYLLQQFFSPHSNRREDEWGGSVEKRMAFPLAIVDEVERVVAHHPEPFIVGYRFSPEEAETPGITMDDTLKLVDALAREGLDYLHVSLNDYWSKPRRGVDDSKTRMEWILEKVNHRVPVIGVGSIYTPEDAARAFESGVDLLALGREIIIDPDWVQKVKEDKVDEIETKIDKNAQERLVVPDPLWRAITNSPGWFPGI